MKDIKINKIRPNKTSERKVEKQERIEKVERIVERQDFQSTSSSKAKINKFSAILFGLMSTSMICYVFMISSSVFYAVKKSQYEFKTESISSNTQTVDMHSYESKNTKSDRISYINIDSQTSVSLK